MLDYQNVMEAVVFIPLLMLAICLTMISVIYSLKKFDSFVLNLVERARVDERFKNDMLSHFYFIIEMASDVSGAAVVAIFVGGIETVFQLIGVFIFGVLMKLNGRRSRDLFMDVVVAGGVSWKQFRQ